MFATSVSPPLKEIDVLINAYALFFSKDSSLSFIKVLHQFLTFSMSLAATQAAYFSPYFYHFTKCSFIFFV
jgi:hypothetical protein